MGLCSFSNPQMKSSIGFFAILEDIEENNNYYLRSQTKYWNLKPIKADNPMIIESSSWI